MTFDRVLVVDWSSASTPSPRRPSADAIWLGHAGGGAPGETYHRTRADALAALDAAIAAALAAGHRLLIGADFPFGYPAGFAAALTGRPRALALWDWLAARIADSPDNANNRFALADAINARFPGIGPFWGRPATLALPHLPDRGSARHGHGLPERRRTEALLPGTQPVWKLYTTGSVGGQALVGIPALARLRARWPGRVAVWPFEPWQAAPVVLAEVWPSVLAPAVRAALAADPGAIRDRVQVRLLADALLAARDRMGTLMAPDAPPAVLAEEGWILGATGLSATADAANGHPRAGPR